MLPRIFPFAGFMVFIGIEELLRFLSGKGFLALSPAELLYLYPVKALFVCAALFYFRGEYGELRLADLRNPLPTISAVLLGLLVFILWINMDWPFATFGELQGYNPGMLPGGSSRTTLIAFRLFGAALVVPVMEELFWRSFLARYLISHDIASVAIGRFTATSFMVSTLLFGLEHNLFLAGIMAGAVYNLLLMKTRSVLLCVLAHGVTNLALGIYVLHYGQWKFW
jgi:CAAX prenyl protease-like protein